MSAAEKIEAPRGHTRAGSLMRVGVAYAVALAAAVGVLVVESEAAHLSVSGPWRAYVALAAADVVATLVVFAFSFAWRNSSVYDPYWSVAPPLVCALSWVLTSFPRAPSAREVLVTAIVVAWAARLTWNWLRSWGGLDHEDFRYRELQRTTGRAYWLVSLAGLHLFPTLVVLLALLPTVAIFAPDGASLGVLDALGAAISLAGIVLEAVADEQLRAFGRTRTSPEQICEVGLWRTSRHPNYFGEILFWTGLAVFAFATGRAEWWAALGVAAIVSLFVFASIPMMEKRQRARKPGWAEYAARTSVLVPLPPRR